MYNTIKHLVEDFVEFRRVRRLNETSELSNTHKTLVLSYNSDFEKELNAIALNALTKELLNENVSPEYVRGFRSALTYRQGFLTYKSKFNK